MVERKQLSKNSTFFIFENIEKDFKKYWKNNELNKHWKDELTHWNALVDWINKYSELYHKIIPENHTRCCIECRQQYKDFTIDEIIKSLQTIGELADHIYCAERDILIGSHVLEPEEYYPLERYYISALEQIVHIVSTFLQSDYKSFTDLSTRLTQLTDIKLKGKVK